MCEKNKNKVIIKNGMIMRKSYLWMLVVIGMATLWAGCSKSNEHEIIDDAPGKILLKSKAMSLEVETKAPFEGTISNSNKLTARVLASTESGAYGSGALHANGTMTFGTNGVDSVVYNTGTGDGFAGNAFYPGTQTLYFAGLYPADTWSSIGTTAAYTIDGKSDVMSAAQQSAKKGDAVPTLAFNHLLTKLEVLVLATDANVANAWGGITDMTLVKLNNGNNPNKVATVTLATGAAAFTAAATDSIPFYIYGTSSPYYTDNKVSALSTALAIPTTAGKVAYSMVTPIGIAAATDASVTNAYTIALKTANSSWINVPVTITKTGGSFTSTAGYLFNITLTFKGSAIEAKATVAEWQDGGTGAGEIK